MNGYEIIAKTEKYGVVKVNGTFRVEDYTHKYKEIPHIEIPKELCNEFLDYLVNYKEIGIKKLAGKLEFNEQCDKMFDDEYDEMSWDETDVTKRYWDENFFNK
jgi:hypothetical protein